MKNYKALVLIGGISVLSLVGCSKTQEVSHDNLASAISNVTISNLDKYMTYLNQAIASDSIDTVNLVYSKIKSLPGLSLKELETLESVVKQFYNNKIQEGTEQYNKTGEERLLVKMDVQLSSYHTLGISNDITLDKAIKLKESKDWFKKGKALQNNGKYIDAIRSYNKVIEEDIYYTEAVGRIEKCKEGNVTQLIERIDSLIEEWQFEEAYKLAIRLTELESPQVQDIVEKTEQAIQQYFDVDMKDSIKRDYISMNYVDMMEKIEVCEKYYPNESELEQFKNDMYQLKQIREPQVVLKTYEYTKLLEDSILNLDFIKDELYVGRLNFEGIISYMSEKQLLLEEYAEVVSNNYIKTYKTQKYVDRFDSLHESVSQYLSGVINFAIQAKSVYEDLNYTDSTSRLYDFVYISEESVKLGNLEKKWQDKAEEVYSRIDQSSVYDYMNK